MKFRQDKAQAVGNQLVDFFTQWRQEPLQVVDVQAINIKFFRTV